MIDTGSQATPYQGTMATSPRQSSILAEETPFRRFLSDFFDSKVAIIAAVVFGVIIFIAVFAPLISPTNPYDLAIVSILDSKLPPGTVSLDGVTFWLGTDGAGRDLVSGIFYGLRISLGVGVTSGVIAMCIGATIGLAAAYIGGRTDNFIMRIVDIQLSFPAILVALILLALLGKGVDKIIIALVIVQWAYYARTVRGSALVERNKEYIEAATCLALGHKRIVFRHLLPNCLPPLIVVGHPPDGPCHYAGSDVEFSRRRSADQRAVTRPAHRQRFRLHAQR